MRRNLFTHALQVQRSWLFVAATIVLRSSPVFAQVTAPETVTPLPSAEFYLLAARRGEGEFIGQARLALAEQFG